MKKPPDIKKIKYIPLKKNPKTKNKQQRKKNPNKQTRVYVNKNQRKKISL